MFFLYYIFMFGILYEMSISMSLNEGGYDGLWGHDPSLRQSMFHMLCHLWLNLIHFSTV